MVVRIRRRDRFYEVRCVEHGFIGLYDNRVEAERVAGFHEEMDKA